MFAKSPSIEPERQGWVVMASLDTHDHSVQHLQIRCLIEQVYGLVFDGSDSGLIDQALIDRMQALGIADLESYLLLLNGRERGSELRRLVDLATVRETRFFRGKGLFAALANDIIPELLSRIRLSGHTGRALHAWSAGCSTGDEAYSVAITLLEAARKHFPLPVRVVGTDISPTALSVATNGVYHLESMDGVGDDLLGRYFTRMSGDCAIQDNQAGRSVGYRVAEVLARCVEFYEHNLVDFPYPSRLNGFDLILCRNVLMYFSESVANRVIRELACRLNDGGYLILDPWAVNLGLPKSGFQDIRCPYGMVVRRVSDVGAGERGTKNRVGFHSTGIQHLEKTPGLDDRSVPGRASTASHDASVPESRRSDDWEETMRLARACADRGSWSEALSLLSEIANEASLDPQLHLLMGEVYVQMADLKAARQSFGRLVYLEPHNPVAHWRMAHVYRLMGKQHSEMNELQNVLSCLEDPEPSYDMEISDSTLLHACVSRIEALREERRRRRSSGPRS